MIFVFLGIVGFFSVLTLIADYFGFFEAPLGMSARVIPISAAFLLLAVAAGAFAFRNLRKMSAPLDEMLEASNRIAAGEFDARVAEAGPPEMRALGRAFNSMAGRLQVNDRQRRAMLADLTHELRTPLTIMRGNLEGMIDGVYPPEESRLRSLLDETAMLARLIDDLRTLAMAESGGLQLRREPTDLAALIRESLAAFGAHADAAGVTLSAALSQPPAVQLDPQRVREVLSNLLTNALRYSPRGATVRVDLTETGSGAERRVRVRVQDQGPGIAAADLPHVFERFYKSSDSGGMGLGLSIARYVVQAHGGEIAVDSPPGQGTIISFSLPL